jgi:hypothetical protein
LGRLGYLLAVGGRSIGIQIGSPNGLYHDERHEKKSQHADYADVERKLAGGAQVLSAMRAAAGVYFNCQLASGTDFFAARLDRGFQGFHKGGL